MRKLIEYLPEVLREVREYKGVFAAQEPEIANLMTAQDDILRSQFLSDETDWDEYRNDTVAAEFVRASVAYRTDGTLIPSGQPRYEGAGVLIEQGTTNLIPLNRQKFVGWTAISGAAVTLTQNQAVAEWGAVDATRIQTSGGTGVGKYYVAVTREDGAYYSNSVWVKNTGDKTVRVTTNVSAKNDNILPGESRRVKLENVGGVDIGALQIQFQALNAADSLDFIAWLPGIEKGAYCTSPTTGTRSPETISVPVPFTPQQGGEISFIVDVNDACKRQVVGQYPMLLQVLRSIGGIGFELCHLPTSANFKLETIDDTGTKSTATFADSLIPNGLRKLDVIHDKAIPAVILYCDGQPIATIDNPALPSGWGRAYLLSSAAGTNQAGSTVGDLQMRTAAGRLLAWWPLQSDLNVLRPTSLSHYFVNRWEKLLKITPKGTETLAERRYRIMTRLIERIPHTIQNLKRQLDYICGADGYSIELFNDEYRLKVRVALTVKYKFDEVKALLARVIPANILLDFSLLYNQHLTLAKYTHAQLSNYTHDFIRNEVLPE